MIRRLPEEALRGGVVAASAGNHAQAVACAARDAGAEAVLVMPEEAPLAKVAAVRQYGGEVRSWRHLRRRPGRGAPARRARRARRSCMHSTQPQVVAGQGTVGLEIAEPAPGVSWWWCRWAEAAWRRQSPWR